MDKNTFHPVGPVGSILIGLVLCGLHLANITVGGASIGWLGFAFLFGGTIMLIVRIMSQKSKELPK